MIRSFGDARTQALFEMSLCETFKLSLGQLSAGSKQLMLPILLDDLLVPPSNRLEKLKGNLK